MTVKTSARVVQNLAGMVWKPLAEPSLVEKAGVGSSDAVGARSETNENQMRNTRERHPETLHASPPGNRPCGACQLMSV